MNFSSLSKELPLFCHQLSGVMEEEQSNFENLLSIVKEKEGSLVAQNFLAIKEFALKEGDSFKVAAALSRDRYEIVQRLSLLLGISPVGQDHQSGLSTSSTSAPHTLHPHQSGSFAQQQMGQGNRGASKKRSRSIKKSSAMDRLFSRLPAVLAVQFEKKAERIRTLAREIKSQIRKNSALVNIGLEQVEFVMETIREKMVLCSNPKTYTASGGRYQNRKSAPVKSLSLNISA